MFFNEPSLIVNCLMYAILHYDGVFLLLLLHHRNYHQELCRSWERRSEVPQPSSAKYYQAVTIVTIKSRFILTLHYITLHSSTFHYITLYYTTLHFTTLHCITLHYIVLHYITLHYIHYITLHYITLHCTTFLSTAPILTDCEPEEKSLVNDCPNTNKGTPDFLGKFGIPSVLSII